MSTNNESTQGSQPVVVDTTTPTLKKIDEKSLDLQQTITNFSLFYGDISEPPSVKEQKYVQFHFSPHMPPVFFVSVHVDVSVVS